MKREYFAADSYVTGVTIKSLREEKGLTQTEPADISLIEPLANTLSVSVIELMTGDNVINKNKSSNILRSKCFRCCLW